MQILPAINCPDFACAKERIRKAEAFSEWMHVDVVDGKFAPPITWGNPEEFAALKTPLKLEAHLMVEDPESALDAWLRAGAKRVVVHLESLKDPVYVLEKCKKFGAEVFLGLTLGTEAERAFAPAGDFQGFLVLAVFPGYSGQPLQEIALEKIRRIKAHAPSAIIEVDGGVNGGTAPRIKAAGADILISASHIFSAGNPADAYHALSAL